MLGNKLNLKTQVKFLKKLRFLLSLDGMVLSKALYKMAESGSGSLAVESEYLIEHIEDNENIYDSFDHFDDRVRSLLAINNSNNTLNNGVTVAIEFLDRELKHATSSFYQFFMPSLVTVVQLIMLAIIGHKLLPQFQDVVPRNEWPVTTKIVAVLGDFLYQFWFVVVIIAVITPISFMYYKSRWVGDLRMWCDKHLPFFGSYRFANATQFLLTLSYLSANNDIVIARALTSISKHSTEYIKYHIELMLDAMGGDEKNNELDIASSLDTGLLHENDITDIRIAEAGKNIAVAIRMVAEEKLTEYENMMDKSKLISQLVMVVLTSLFSVLIIFSIAPLALNMQNAFTTHH